MKYLTLALIGIVIGSYPGHSQIKTIKVEWIYNQNFINQEQAQLSIFEWIESWYNRRWRHSAIGYQTIEEPKRCGARRSQIERNNHIFINAAWLN